MRNLWPWIFGQIILIFNVRVDGARNIAISRWSWIRVWWGYNYGQTQKCTWMGSSFVISYVMHTHHTVLTHYIMWGWSVSQALFPNCFQTAVLTPNIIPCSDIWACFSRGIVNNQNRQRSPTLRNCVTTWNIQINMIVNSIAPASLLVSMQFVQQILLKFLLVKV